MRFQWGAFTFDGVLTTLNETLELFSHDGRPLRSRISLSFASQEIQFRIEESGGGGGAGGAGQTPRTPVGQGDSVQQLAGKAGGSTSTGRRSPRPTASRTRACRRSAPADPAACGVNVSGLLGGRS